MELVTPYARILPPPYLELDNSPVSKMREFDGVELLRRIEYCARISHRSEDMPADTDRFLRAVVLKHGDWSVVEHASITVEFLVDRGVTHELVRHRIFSITQESTRFVNYLKRVSARFIKPSFPDDDTYKEDSCFGIWAHAVDTCMAAYTQLIKLGCTPQIARSVLPNALSSKIVITGNLRQWRHFFIMRTTKETHPQMREVTVPLLDEIKKVIPIIFEDIEPGALQRDNLKLPR
jgi:thymidylate synthase (FAD)